MRHPKLPGLLLLAGAIALTGCTDSSSDDAPKPDYRLAILHINDHHSNLDESDASLRLRTGSDDTRTSVPIKLGGFPRVATAMAELSARHDNVLKLHAGDAITGTLYYTLSEGEADAALMNRVCFDAMAVGNHELDSETSVKYELGLRYKLTNDDVISVNAYYNDIFDYIQTVSVPQVRRGIDGITYINLDYARGRGMEIEYRTRFAKYFSGNLNGSYSIITTKSSSSDDGLLLAQNLLDEQPIKEVFARWDRPWQLSANLSINVPKGDNPNVFGLKLPSDWQMNFRWFAQSGRRYTPVEFVQIRPNDGRPIYQSTTDQTEFFSQIGKHWKWADLSFTKYFGIAGMEYGLTLEVKNLFNDQNPTIINPVTGNAYEIGDDVPEGWNDPRYPDVFYPISSPFPSDPSRWRTPRNIRMGLFMKF